ncbi:MAG: hypothetical protein K2X98_00565 [Alphaproteobacteria bacterium]|nr:hypothetical protein [Alphaproteobacteria bacterium]
MRVTLNDFKERVVFKKYISSEKDGEIKRKLKKTKVMWGAIQALSLQNAAQALTDTVDGRLRLSQAYLLYVRDDPGDVDSVSLFGKNYRRLSALQKEGIFWRCIVGSFEEKDI